MKLILVWSVWAAAPIDALKRNVVIVVHSRLQAWAYLGIAQVNLNHAYSYHEDWTRRHVVTSIEHMRAQM